MGKTFKEDTRNFKKYSHKTSRASGRKFFKRGLKDYNKTYQPTDKEVDTTFE